MSDTEAGPATPTPPSLPPIRAPFLSGPLEVRREWIDENGHLNLAYYILLFDQATDALWRSIGLGPPFRATQHGTFAVETHTLYRAELLEGEDVMIQSQIVGLDPKRLHVAHEMRRGWDDVIAAQQELMYLCVDLETRRASAWPETVYAGLKPAAEAHAGMGRPEWVGRQVLTLSPA